MIKNNPFLSDSFITIWSKHFNQARPSSTFNFIPKLSFTKKRFLPIFINFGKTLTKGVSYSLSHQTTADFKKKVFLIYDVPTYFENEVSEEGKALKLYRSKQYPGFLISLEKYKDFNDYMLLTFSKSSRYKLNKYKKRFEACFDISYRMYCGEISKEDYDFVFENFKRLLERRFNDKQITNNNLDPDEWEFYYEVTHPMLLQKKASLFVIYDGDKPIGVTLSFLSDTILFDAITVFDIDYSKFHLGSVTIMKLVEWCLEQKLQIFDFSKGYFDYKTRWSDRSYDFEYHIYYDPSSLRARAIALFFKKFFDLKQLLREKNVNEKLHRFTFRLKNKGVKMIGTTSYTFTEISGAEQISTSVEIDLNQPMEHRIKLMAFEFLYLNDECYTELKTYRASQNSHKYYFIGKTKKVMATLE